MHHSILRRPSIASIVSIAIIVAVGCDGPTSPADTDAGHPTIDGGFSDAGLTDAGLTDAGLTDAGLTDAGLTDAGAPALDGGGCAPSSTAHATITWTDIVATEGCSFFSAPAPYGHEYDLGTVGTMIGAVELRLGDATFAAVERGFTRTLVCPWRTGTSYRFVETIEGAWEGGGVADPACSPSAPTFRGTYTYDECTGASEPCVPSGCTLTANVEIVLSETPAIEPVPDDEALCEAACAADVIAAEGTECVPSATCEEECVDAIGSFLPRCQDIVRATQECGAQHPEVQVCDEGDLVTGSPCQELGVLALRCLAWPEPTGACAP